MCNGRPDSDWRGVGVSSWEGRLQAFEQCTECGEYRARILEPNAVRVVQGQPDYGDQENDAPIGRTRGDTPPDIENVRDESFADDESDGDDWLIE